MPSGRDLRGRPGARRNGTVTAGAIAHDAHPGLHLVIPNAVRDLLLHEKQIPHCVRDDSQVRKPTGRPDPHTVPRFFPIHGAYHSRSAAMSAAMSPVVANSGPMPMRLSG